MIFIPRRRACPVGQVVGKFDALVVSEANGPSRGPGIAFKDKGTTLSAVIELKKPGSVWLIFQAGKLLAFFKSLSQCGWNVRV